MRKFSLLLLAFAGLWACPAFGDDDDYGAEFIQICFAPGVPGDCLTTPTYGVKVGAPMSDGAEVCGVEASVIYAGSREVCGFQGSLVTADADEVEGLQLSLVNFVRECSGLQLGIVNFAKEESFQIGILNFIKDGWLPCFPLINFNF